MTTLSELQTLSLSAYDLKELTKWPDSMIEDYLTIIQNLTNIAGGTDSNSEAIAANALAIAANATAIAANATAIAANATAIALNATNLANHIADDSAHGVTGDNIGTGDFAQTAIGGAVFLADLVTNASASSVSVTAPSATGAPPAYSQAHSNELVTLANQCKTVINAFLSLDYDPFIANKFNLLLTEQKDAKQMSTV